MISNDKENQNFANIHSTHKIKKKSAKKRFHKERTIQAIRKLTEHLKNTLDQKPKCKPSIQNTNQNLISTNSVHSFICYDDKQVVGSCGELPKLLHHRIADNDVDSDEEQVAVCVEYLSNQLEEAGQPWKHKMH